MSLSHIDENQIQSWFYELHKSINNSKSLSEALADYYKYRDLISNLVLEKLSDLFEVKKYEWSKRNNVREDDSVSIIHDALLSCLNNFDPSKKVKFLTYFYRSLYSRLFNHINKTKKLKKGQSKNIPENNVCSLTALFSESRGTIGKFESFNKHRASTLKERLILSLVDHIVTEANFSQSEQECRLLVYFIMENLPKGEQFVLECLLKGYTYSETADKLDIPLKIVKSRVKTIRNKFRKVQKDLCQNEKI